MLISMTFDERLFFALHSFAGKSRGGDAAIFFLAEYLPYLIAFAYFYFCALFAPQFGTTTVLALTLIPALFSRFVIVPIIRALYNRLRPYEKFEVNPLFRVHEPSFPSGHAAFFCSLAVTLVPFSATWGAFMLAVSVFAVVFRVVAGVHYPSDVIAGALVGVGTTMLFQYFFALY